MPTVRGQMTASSTPRGIIEELRERRSQGTAAKPEKSVDPENPLKGASRFIARGKKEKILRIAFLPRDYRPRRAKDFTVSIDEDDRRTEACVQALKAKHIRFSRHSKPSADGKKWELTADGQYTTREKAIIEWLRYRIRMGIFPDLYEDVSMADIPCPQGCGFSVKNTDKGHAALSRHMLESHYTESATEPTDEDDAEAEEVQTQTNLSARLDALLSPSRYETDEDADESALVIPDPEETSEERKRRLGRENLAKARAAKKARVADAA